MNEFTYKDEHFNYITFEGTVKYIFTTGMPPSLVKDDDIILAAKEHNKQRLQDVIDGEAR